MLEHLYIKNFILIDQLNLDFKSGFSSITGETGAGKSIFLDALSLLLGKVASSSLVQKGKEKAVIEATFSLEKDSKTSSFLQENGFDINDFFIITREISANGRSLARVDHRVVSLKFLQMLVSNQLDIHSQKEATYLLQKSNHDFLLDEYAKLHDFHKKVNDYYIAYKEAIKNKDDFIFKQLGKDEIDFYQYQLSQLEEANLKVGEEDDLKEKERKIKIAQKSANDYHSFFQYYDNELSSSLYHMLKLIDHLENIDEQAEQIHNAYETILDSVEEIRSILNPSFSSEEEINEIEERLFLIQRLKRKFGPGVKEILKYQDELRLKLDNFARQDEYLKELDQKISTTYEEYQKQASLFNEKRKDIAQKLEKEVKKQLVDLQLENSQFKINFISSEDKTKLIKNAEFFISMNKGEELKPLVKVASGGELSRFMLALKVIFSKLQGIKTLIFDEIDTGVSGHVATAIGEKMNLLAKDCQVFAVTHLAQVAALADQQYYVYKEIVDQHTLTHVILLNNDERINELAYLFSGSNSEKAKAVAKELLEGKNKYV